MSLVEVLRTSPVFSALSPSAIELLGASVSEREYAPGACIFSQGDDALQLLLLVDGNVALQVYVPGRSPSIKVTVDWVTAEQVFGWDAIVEHHVRSTSAICLRTARVLLIDGAVLRSLMQDAAVGYGLLHECARALTASLGETRVVLASERLATALF